MPENASTKVSRMGRSVRVLITEGHPLIRSMVRSTVQVQPEIDVCGEAMDGAQAIEEAKKLKPDVVVMDVIMPVLNGFEAAREIKTILPESAIVILSLHADRVFIEEAKEIGVRAYVATKR